MRERTNITPQQRMERRQQAKAKAKNYYQLQKYAALAYDYEQIEPAHRGLVQEAALEIHKWQRNTIELGETLLAVKEVLPHRQFMEWLQVEFDMSERMIQHTMNVARTYGAPEKRNIVTVLSPSALYLLAAPSTPKEARAEVEAMLYAGQVPTRADVKRVVLTYMQPKPKQLPGPVASTGSATLPNPQVGIGSNKITIDAEYTVIHTGASLIQLTLTREMVECLHLACLSRKSLREIMTDKEGDSGMLDRFFILCQRALEA